MSGQERGVLRGPVKATALGTHPSDGTRIHRLVAERFAASTEAAQAMASPPSDPAVPVEMAVEQEATSDRDATESMDEDEGSGDKRGGEGDDAEDDDESDEEEEDDDDDDDEESQDDAEGMTDDAKRLRAVSKALKNVTPPGDFFFSGERDVFPQPGITINGFGELALPLVGDAATALIAKCHLAPYGHGEKTLVDIQVRNTWELSADQLQIENPNWNKMVQNDIVASCRIPLGIQDSVQVEAKLYKMLLYEAGGKFETHQDSEKEDGMFGTLVVVLPGRFEGGELHVCDPSVATAQGAVASGSAEGTKKHVWDPAKMDPFAIKYVAFYGDCPHEVKPVTKGYRLCLTYNLVNVTAKVAPRFGGNHDLFAALKHALRQYFWDDHDARQKRQRVDASGASNGVASDITSVETQRVALLASVLTHKYTKRGLSFQYLKNKDALVAQCLARFCEESGGAFKLYLSKLRYRFDWHGDEDTWYDGESDEGVTRTVTLVYPWVSYSDPPQDEDGDAGEEDVAGMASIPKPYEEDGLELDPETEVVPRGLFASDKIQFDGKNEQMYTGNEGANLEKWYSSAAFVVVSLKLDTRWKIEEDVETALQDFVNAVHGNKPSHARTVASTFSTMPKAWSLVDAQGVQVVDALHKLADQDAVRDMLLSCVLVDFQPKLRDVAALFTTEALAATLKTLSVAWGKANAYKKVVHRNRVNVVASTLHGVRDAAAIGPVLDAVALEPFVASDSDDTKLQGSDTTPEEYTRVLVLAFTVSADRVTSLVQTTSAHALVLVVVPALLQMIATLGDQAKQNTDLRSVIQQLRTQVEAKLPEIRNLSFVMRLSRYDERDPALTAFMESEDLSAEFIKSEFELKMHKILETQGMLARLTVEPLEEQTPAKVRVTKSYNSELFAKATAQLATLLQLVNGD